MTNPLPLPEGLRFVDAEKEDHFIAMSLIHALGWRDTYRGPLGPGIPKEF